VGQRGTGLRRLGAFPPDRLVVVSAGDGVHDLGLVEVFRARDLGDEAHQVPVQQHLGLQAGGAFGTPDGLASAAGRHLHRVRVDPGLPQVRVDAAVPQRVGHPTGTILIHGRQATFSRKSPNRAEPGGSGAS
jgi:hypothetical protein